MKALAIAERYRQIESQLYAYQRPHTKQLLRSLYRSRDALDASDTGTGKTFAALAAMHALNLPTLIVCPKSVMDFWKKCALRMQVAPPEVINYEMLRTGRTAYGTWIGKHFRWNIEGDALIIFDECHRLKDWRTKQCEIGLSAIAAGFYVMGLSATAADNPMHMKFVTVLTKLIKRPEAFFGWMLRHGVRKVRLRQARREVMMFTGGQRVLMHIHNLIFPAHGSRMRIADLGDQFPETLIISEAYDMDEAEEIQRIYAEMKAEIKKLEARMEKDWKANVLTAQLRARQKVELLKVPTLVAMAHDGVAEGMSVVIFVNFAATLQALSHRLETFSVVHGDQTAQDRNQWLNRFQQDKEHIIICNIKAGGVGVSLHGTRPRLALICPTFSGQDLKQALGRVHRAGGSYSIQKIVWAANTVEEEACDKVRAKLSRINTLNDGQLAEALAF
jgi:superfamily II DNA or RNA helicase